MSKMDSLFSEAKYKKYREHLKAAIASQDIGLLMQAIQEFEANGVPEKKGDLTKAKKLLEFLQISQGSYMYAIGLKLVMHVEIFFSGFHSI